MANEHKHDRASSAPTHSHSHSHGHIHEHRDIRPLRIAIALTGSVFLVQVVGGFLSGSLALLSDAGHVLIDLASLLVAFIGLRIAAKAREQHDARYTFGLRRIEILAALTNGMLLFGICIYILIEAVRRFAHPEHVHAGAMLVVAVIGFIANAISARYLHKSEHITTRSAYLHVITDLLSSGGVIVGAIVIALTDWDWVDPVLSILIALLVIRGSIRVIREAGIILMESSPNHILPAEVKTTLLALEGVSNVHDVHVWQLGAKEYAASVHIVSSRPSDDVVIEVQRTLREQFSIGHTTVQVESHNLHDTGDCGAC
ncbi:MAG: cation diffusion facilitator family transporter [bacterium]|nr:cation diffusion facilitator family transporter [bacterium]